MYYSVFYNRNYSVNICFNKNLIFKLNVLANKLQISNVISSFNIKLANIYIHISDITLQIPDQINLISLPVYLGVRLAK